MTQSSFVPSSQIHGLYLDVKGDVCAKIHQAVDENLNGVTAHAVMLDKVMHACAVLMAVEKEIQRSYNKISRIYTAL